MTTVDVMRESHTRSLLKAFSWRIVATMSTMIIAWFITGQLDTALSIGGIEFVAKFLIYYFHERLWQIIPRGHVRYWFKKKGKDDNPESP